MTGNTFVCALGWVVLLAAAAPADEADAVATLKKVRAEIKRDGKLPGKPIVGVRLRGSEVTDAVLKELAGLKKCTELTLSSLRFAWFGGGFRERVGAVNCGDELHPTAFAASRSGSRPAGVVVHPAAA